MYILNTSLTRAVQEFRPNQAVQRAVYYFPDRTTTRQLQGLGQMSTTSVLALAAAAGLGAWFLFGRKKSAGRRIARLAAQRALAGKKLRELGA